MLIPVIDTETTSFDDAKVVELGVVEVNTETLKIGKRWSALVNPERNITIGAMGAHHITEEMVAGQPTWEATLETAQEKLGYPLDATLYRAAHNAKFDSQFFEEGIDFICTWRCAKHLWPDAESFSNQALRYYLNLKLPEWFNDLTPHRALPDATITALILIEMLRERPAKELMLLTKSPLLLDKVTFGKHYGEQWDNVPKSYLQWILRSDFDEDTAYTARFHLGMV